LPFGFPFSVELSVRGYEIDLWGHVNNAVYVQWLEESRWQMARAGDFAMKLGDVLPVVRHLELDYTAETVLGDRVRVTLWPRKVGTTSFTFGAAIRIVGADDVARVGKLALRATMVLACMRPGEGKVAVPDELRRYFPPADPGVDLPAGV
jgi:thioesterase III